MMFHAFLPKVLALVAVIKVEFHRVLVVAISLRMQFDEIFLPLKTNLSYFGPRKCVDFGEILEDKNPHVGHSEIQWNTFMVLGSMHFYTIEFTSSGSFK